MADAKTHEHALDEEVRARQNCLVEDKDSSSNYCINGDKDTFFIFWYNPGVLNYMGGGMIAHAMSREKAKSLSDFICSHLDSDEPGGMFFDPEPSAHIPPVVETSRRPENQ